MHNGRAFQMESLLVGCFWFECVIRSTAMFPWIILSCNLRQNYKQFFLKIERKTIKHVNVNIFYITRSTQIDKILIGKTDLLLKVKFSLALFPMKSVWNVPGKASALNPPPLTSSEPSPPLPVPPDPPGPDSPLSPHQFPPLSTGSKPLSSKKTGFKFLKNSSIVVANLLQPVTTEGTSVQGVSENQKIVVKASNTITFEPHTLRSTVPATVQTLPQENNPQTFRINPPKSPSPINTNKASTPLVHLQESSSNPAPSSNHDYSPPTPPTVSTQAPPTADPILISPTDHTLPSTKNAPAPVHVPSLVERFRAAEDKTLRRLAPVTISPSGRPRILILDSVFKAGAEIHKDFIICYFNGKTPPFNQIQSVFNHMWGKGQRLEINNNPLNRTTLVRIPSEYLRKKILEKNIWYVGYSMFHTAQWSSEHSSATPPLKAIKIWAHLTGVPLDLRYNAGLSLVVGLVGEPKETDDFTKNMVSLTVSHVKVEVDLTKPLPSVVEFERESGEVVEVSVHYPWVPPTCTHCHELGHIIRNYLQYTPPPSTDPPITAKSQGKKPSSSSTPVSKSTRQIFLKKTVASQASDLIITSEPGALQSDEMMIDKTALKPLSDIAGHKILDAPADLCLSPDPIPRPSLKRSRSSPTLSPPLSSNPNPFFFPLFIHPLPQLSFYNISPLTLNLPSPQKPLCHKKSILFSFTSHRSSKNCPLANEATKYYFFFTRESISDGGDPPSFPMCIKLFFWNVCGLNDPDKHRPFISWLFTHKPLFWCNLETHIKETSLPSLMSKLCNGWNFSSNHASDADGRIILIWRNPLTVQVIRQSRQTITCLLSIPSKESIYYTALYASNLSAERNDLWAELLHLHDTLDLENKKLDDCG